MNGILKGGNAWQKEGPSVLGDLFSLQEKIKIFFRVNARKCGTSFFKFSIQRRIQGGLTLVISRILC